MVSFKLGSGLKAQKAPTVNQSLNGVILELLVQGPKLWLQIQL